MSAEPTATSAPVVENKAEEHTAPAKDLERTEGRKHAHDDEPTTDEKEGPDSKRKPDDEGSSSSLSEGEEEDKDAPSAAADTNTKTTVSSLFSRTVSAGSTSTFGLSLKPKAATGGFGGVAAGFGTFGGGFSAIKAPVPAASSSAPVVNGFSSLAKGSTGFQWGSSTAAAKPGVASGDKTQAEKDRAREAAEKGPVLKADFKAESGEENETRVLEAQAKLYCFVKGESGPGVWQERGAGLLHLNDRKAEDGSLSSRLVMRQNLSKRLFLNAPVWKGLKVEKLSDKNITFTAINYASEEQQKDASLSAQVFLVKLGAKDALSLTKNLEKRVKDLPVKPPVEATKVSAAHDTKPESQPTKVQEDSKPTSESTSVQSSTTPSSDASSVPAAVTTTAATKA